MGVDHQPHVMIDGNTVTANYLIPVLGIPTRQTREPEAGSAWEPCGMPWSTMGDGHPSSNIRSQDWLVCHYCRRFGKYSPSQGILLQDTNCPVESWTRKSWWHWSNCGCNCHYQVSSGFDFSGCPLSYRQNHLVRLQSVYPLLFVGVMLGLKFGILHSIDMT